MMINSENNKSFDKKNKTKNIECWINKNKIKTTFHVIGTKHKQNKVLQHIRLKFWGSILH